MRPALTPERPLPVRALSARGVIRRLIRETQETPAQVAARERRQERVRQAVYLCLVLPLVVVVALLLWWGDVL